MTKEEAIKVIKSNYPPARYSMLCEALDMAIESLSEEEPEEGRRYELGDEWRGEGD